MALSSFATPVEGKLPSNVKLNITSSKTQVPQQICTVTVSNHVLCSYTCVASGVTYTTLVCASATVTAVTCQMASHDAQVIANSDIINQTISWHIQQIVACSNFVPEQ